MSPPVPTPIYHISLIGNLPSIIADGELRCWRSLHQENVAYEDLANNDIQRRRANKAVKKPPFGTLHDYVPFFFAPRPPMLCKFHKDRTCYPQGQTPVIHLMSTVQTVAEAEHPFVFTDGHAVKALSEPYVDLADLDKIDWPLMKARYWDDTQEDGDRRRRRQAEFLVHHRFPWELITLIGVLNDAVALQAETLLELAVHKPRVQVRKDWYY